jgi:hypothetical protein
VISYSPKLTFKLINDVASTNCKIKNDEEKHSIFFSNENINSSVNPIRVSNIFNKYFTTIGSNLGGLINKSNFHHDEPNTTESFDTIFNKKVSVDEVLLIINNLKDKTAVGHDSISVKTLKLIAQNISLPLTYSYNLRISEGIFPDIFKLAIIKPLYKNGDQTRVGIYIYILYKKINKYSIIA